MDITNITSYEWPDLMAYRYSFPGNDLILVTPLGEDTIQALWLEYQQIFNGESPNFDEWVREKTGMPAIAATFTHISMS